MFLLKSAGLDSSKILLEGCAEGWVAESWPMDGEGSEKNANVRMKITRFRRIIYKQKLRTKSLSRYLFSTPRKHIHTGSPIKPQFPITSPDGLNFPVPCLEACAIFIPPTISRFLPNPWLQMMISLESWASTVCKLSSC